MIFFYVDTFASIILILNFMKKKNHIADMRNADTDSEAKSKIYKKAIENRSNQLNPNNKRFKPRKSKSNR